jgi:hypothetical protein
MNRAHRSPTRAAALLALSLAAAGCGETFTPPSVVEDRRVLALVADPPALDASAPGATTTVRAVEAQPIDPPALPAGTSLERRWSFCPFSLGAATGYACAVPQCEAPLLPDAGGAVSVEPRREVEGCLAALGAAAPPELLGGLPPVVEVLVRWRLVAVTPAQPDPARREVVLREAVQRLPVWTQPPTAPLNTQPGFADTASTPSAAVLVGLGASAVEAEACLTPDPAGVRTCPSAGRLSRGSVLRVVAAVDPTTIEDYAVGDRTASETFALSFFTTAGRFDDDRGAASRELPAVAVGLRHEEVPAGTEDALVWVVLRDLRGGQAARGPFRIQVDPP